MLQLCEANEFSQAQSQMQATFKQHTETKLTVLAKSDESKWRSVLASLYEHKSTLAPVLIKCMCESLLETLKQECLGDIDASLDPNSWSFDKMESSTVGQDETIAENACFIAPKLLSTSDRELNRALDFIRAHGSERRQQSENLVFLSIFLSQEAVQILT